MINKKLVYFVELDAQEIMPYKSLITNTTTKEYETVNEKAYNHKCQSVAVVHETHLAFIFESTVDRDAFYNEIVEIVKTAIFYEKEVEILDPAEIKGKTKKQCDA